jgi:hypothetical protein
LGDIKEKGWFAGIYPTPLAGDRYSHPQFNLIRLIQETYHDHSDKSIQKMAYLSA